MKKSFKIFSRTCTVLNCHIIVHVHRILGLMANSSIKTDITVQWDVDIKKDDLQQVYGECKFNLPSNDISLIQGKSFYISIDYKQIPSNYEVTFLKPLVNDNAPVTLVIQILNYDFESYPMTILLKLQSPDGKYHVKRKSIVVFNQKAKLAHITMKLSWTDFRQYLQDNKFNLLFDFKHTLRGETILPFTLKDIIEDKEPNEEPRPVSPPSKSAI